MKIVCVVLLMVIGICQAQDDAPCAKSVAAMTRSADVILVTTVKSVGKPPGYWSGVLAAHQQVTYVADKVLKGELKPGEFTVEHLVVAKTRTVEKDSPELRHSLFYAGNKVILFLHVQNKLLADGAQQVVTGVLPDDCAVLEPTPAAIAEVKHAVKTGRNQTR